MKRIVFMGTPDFAVPVLQKLLELNYDIVLVVTQPDRPKGRKKVITPPPVKEEAIKHNLEVFQPEKLRDDFKMIIDLKPDLIVTAAYGQILPREILESPSYGCINVHASLLPELRGGAPIHYAIMQGKDVTGVTIMYMAEKLDAGDILTQVEVPIEQDDHVGTMHDKLSQAGANLLIETLPSLFNNEITPRKQDESLVTFASNIKREEERIDWSKSAKEIVNHIRGLHPWPVAFTTYEGQVMKIWWGEETSPLNKSGNIGEIIEKDSNGFYVQCGNKSIVKISEIQPAGKKRMLVEDYLKGSQDRIKLGVKLGD
ncbi:MULTISPECIES: methionyl-tRNA formyltransferase [Oceanobacillus]|uniref:Methionyl-tRNA formyltransferase n=1 Tax=Oceanobacillus kimchii TaxID=746691 RepID=A0ABQ5TGE3_9BACI|nr:MULTISPECIES: methionyl-tRNA formyltransferase [Oceanobacillus]MBT2598761.1 methionyl-tRNA formyltransferase [Oceanobacillus sp. ISL-74]MBT2651680.1 methionyl-tRNA formyltransferase [Oceanobacillus sp. ISL-73]OEH54611.1 methionyl-tRNA formyltransferase [Oceanobacillus sp. E9]GLO65943.1 methionyl-tRNA formyltransferase [Oceanobacillus kimchii]